MQDRRNFVKGLSASAAMAALGPMAARAQGGPIEQVRILYGFPAGSAGDSVARRVGEKLGGSAYTKNMGVVENKPGAGGRIALEALRSASGDGSVIALSQVSAFSVYPFIYSKLSYKPEDFHPLSIGAIMHHGLAVGPAVPASVKSLKDYLEWAKANPEQANFGSPGAGSLPHLIGALLSLRSGVKLNHVPYRGMAPGVSDLVGGQISTMMGPSGDFLSYYRAGKLRVLATSGPKRNPYLPNVPTFAEQGFNDLTTEEWFGFYANAKTPAEVRARAHAAIVQALKSDSVKESLGVVGLIVTSSTPEEMARSQQAEYERWGPLVKQIGFNGDS
ncbi:Bug family tripartite tricarboxylate transporter substrate binding protein [Comamonas guangdongensis]|uniref:Bug family tripartite tricarboxylate transporter substrate binding protein n=1 Tax=Comamonas guangdongensis TaxID=510515 RepID=A0ABV3ZSU9_9BURK